MARYSTETKLSPERVIEKARAYFGTEMGLDTTDDNPCCITFEGGGGFVSVTVNAGEKKTAVELETREWDYQVKQFMREIG
jgi:hypothetical protein